ncbi:ATP-dependent zinc protease [Spongiibacter sp.]|uniref:ATP-dependent zinc protease family protein n=1 Tax=Spongiibacter sp. TaxID=2024860 RepID=UPI0035628D67
MKVLQNSVLAVAATIALSATAMSSATPVAAEKTVFGISEYVYIEELGVQYQAKIDTGAESASINAINAKVEKGVGDKPDIVHFDLVLPSGELRSTSLPLEKHIRIIRRAGDIDEGDKYYHRRPVLELTLCVGGQSRKVEVNLADRRQFSKAMLVGSEPLIAFNAVVDPSAKYLQDSRSCGKPRPPSDKESAE